MYTVCGERLPARSEARLSHTEPTGNPQTQLIVLRGNSASGKSSVASDIRDAYGRGLAIVRQDVLRRELLFEKDRPDAANIGLIDLTCRYCLDQGFHVLLEGILYTKHYGHMLHQLVADHVGQTSCFYFDVSFEETLRRHATKPQATEYGEQEMQAWYLPLDSLPFVVEHRISEATSRQDAVSQILRTTGLVRPE